MALLLGKWMQGCLGSGEGARVGWESEAGTAGMTAVGCGVQRSQALLLPQLPRPQLLADVAVVLAVHP